MAVSHDSRAAHDMAITYPFQNVTYGYTGASFSGRMPCVEIADDIVQTGRETLEKVCRNNDLVKSPVPTQQFAFLGYTVH
jgi:hypothetical protein